jgi:hypothetical protein
MSWFSWSALTTLGGNILLGAFGQQELPTTTPRNRTVPDPVGRVTAALDGENWDNVAALYNGDAGMILTPDLLRRIELAMLGSEEGRQELAARPRLAGAVLSSADPEALQGIDLSTCFGDAKDDVMSAAVMAISRKRAPLDGMELDRDGRCDPARFSLLAQQIPTDMWNDTGGGIAPKRGLGPIVCGQLWGKGNYDQICELIDQGVDTSTSAPFQPGMSVKARGGRVQPLQHVVSPLLKRVGALPPVDDPATAPAKNDVEGARKILAALNANGGSVTLTSYAAIESCEMLTAFKKKPGTIWGFEEVRQPYVQAAHETDKGKEPLRMLELWEAVGPVTTDYAAYEKLLIDPDNAVKELVAAGRQTVEEGINSGNAKFAEIAGHEDAYIAKFEKFATNFLKEFGQLMPKGTAARPKLDDSGAAKRSETVSEAAGIMPGGLMAGLACKAGLWWAKEERAPVYYCLDGVNMADVTDYKKVKNKTIEDYIAKGGKAGGGSAHNEGVTMVEVREILKNWEELKDTIVFVEKGVILKGKELDTKVKKWRDDMKSSNETAGKTPAPPKATFTGDLNKIDPGLLARIPDDADGRKDARDIVRKFGYLEKIANTKPQIALNYLMSKCGVLVRYDIVPAELTKAAAELVMIDPDAPMGNMMEACAAVKAPLARCHADLQKPLEAALLRHPLMFLLDRMHEHDY